MALGHQMASHPIPPCFSLPYRSELPKLEGKAALTLDLPGGKIGQPPAIVSKGIFFHDHISSFYITRHS
jgi:hypothetical protein